MRIGSGALRGRKLHAPKGQQTRPTSGRLKKSLFDVLAPRLEDAVVLDLFAGAGALGIEALSRGAKHAVFVEKARRACDAIERNLEELALEGRAELRRGDVRAKLVELGGPFDVVFADPPYGSGALGATLAALGDSELVARGGLVVVEHHHKEELGESHGRLETYRVLRSGESCFTLYRAVC